MKLFIINHICHLLIVISCLNIFCKTDDAVVPQVTLFFTFPDKSNDAEQSKINGSGENTSAILLPESLSLVTHV